MRFLLIRPIVDSEIVARQLHEKDHIAYIDPLIFIESLKNISIKLSDYGALIFTSPNAVRSYCQSNLDRNIKVFAVGAKTTKLAKERDFIDVIDAGGDVIKLSNTIKNHLSPRIKPLLYLCGKHVSGDLKGALETVGFTIDKKEIYQAIEAKNLSEETKANIKNGRIEHIPFYSKRSALIFIELAKKAKLVNYLTNITALCLSPSIETVAVSVNWKKIMTARNPNQTSLFKLIDIEL